MIGGPGISFTATWCTKLWLPCLSRWGLDEPIILQPSSYKLAVWMVCFHCQWQLQVGSVLMDSRIQLTVPLHSLEVVVTCLLSVSLIWVKRQAGVRKPGRQIKKGKLNQVEGQKGRRPRYSQKIRKADKVAATLTEEHKRQSDREQVEMGQYIYCRDNEGGGTRWAGGWSSQVMGDSRNRGYCRSGGSGWIWNDRRVSMQVN